MSDSGAGARLVVPEGLLVDETVRERLERGLALAPAAVAGIAAELRRPRARRRLPGARRVGRARGAVVGGRRRLDAPRSRRRCAAPS